MISLSLSNLVALMVALPLMGVGLLAFFYSVQSRHRPSHEKESIYECVECGHVYAVARNRPMDRCPRCLHLNEAVRT